MGERDVGGGEAKFVRAVFGRMRGLWYLCRMNMLMRAGHRILRWPRSYGFGVQSPFAYRFVRFVVNEKWPYYAYGALYDAEPIADKTMLKRCRLCLRLANHLQPKRWWMSLPEAATYATYVGAGCRKTEVIRDCARRMVSESAASQVLMMALTADWEELFDRFAAVATQHSVLLVTDIDATKESRRAWRRLVDDDRTGVSFDLLDCGIVFFDLKMHKRNYKINY